MTNQIKETTDGLWVGTMLDGEVRWAIAGTTGVVEEARNRLILMDRSSQQGGDPLK